MLGIVVAGVIAIGVWRWVDRPAADAGYRFAPVKTADITQTVSANGTLNPVVLVNVGTQVSGTVVKLDADFNDRVKAGQILLELDPALLAAQVAQDEANLASAQAGLELAKANEARAATLWQQDSIAKQEVDTTVQLRKAAQAQVAQANAQLAKDRTNLSYSVIRSPVAGVVVNRSVDLGQTVAASFQTPTLFQIAQDLRKMQIDSSFAEADIGSIKVGQAVQFSVDAFPNRSFAASVKQVRLNATTQQNVVTYDVVVAVDNPDLILMPGMTAYVNVIVAQHAHALAVPNAALRFRPDEVEAASARTKPPQVSAVGIDGVVYARLGNKLRPVPVKLGISDGRVTEITAGSLAATDEVALGAVESASAESTQSSMRMRLF
jgi:HlyD family secretion protein